MFDVEDSYYRFKPRSVENISIKKPEKDVKLVDLELGKDYEFDKEKIYRKKLRV